jgi:hypothetical protein
MVTTRYARRIKRAGIAHASLEETQADFERWFRERFIDPKGARVSSHVEESYPFVDLVIRQEDLVEDLESVLRELGLETPPLRPWKRRTKGKLDDYSRYYSESLIPRALEAFEYEMKMFGYEPPAAWNR